MSTLRASASLRSVLSLTQVLQPSMAAEKRRAIMANGKPGSWKNCVTCQFWTGPRRPSTFRDRAEYGSDSDKGECAGWQLEQTTKNRNGYLQ
jgi:hypothetical protein